MTRSHGFTLYTLAFVGVAASLAAAAGASAAEPTVCVPAHVDDVHETITASADLIHNLWRMKGSVRYESLRLLRTAERELDAAVPVSGKCAPQCRLARQANILLSATPKSFRTGYQDYNKCARYLSTTSVKPLQFEPRGFDSLESLNDWLSEVSQGNGSGGRNLYERCDGACSPQYHVAVVVERGRYVVALSAVCGHARDRSENLYRISRGLRWQCEAE